MTGFWLITVFSHYTTFIQLILQDYIQSSETNYISSDLSEAPVQESYINHVSGELELTSRHCQQH